MLRILKNSLSSCSDVDVLLHCDSVVQHYVVFSPPDVIQRISVRFLGVPPRKYRWVASVLFLTGLFQHLFRLVVHLLSFTSPCLTPRLPFFLITCPGIEVTSRLFWSNSVGTREDFIFLPQLQ